MSNRDSLGDRMKGYENISRNYLTRRVPAIIRIDGKAFHTFTRGFKKPFDRVLMSAMQDTMLELCKNIQGCVFGYTQSDEITLVLTDYENIDTDAWFGYNIQKMASISASMTTLYFQKAFSNRAKSKISELQADNDLSVEDTDYIKVLENAMKTGAMFDARAFTIPKEEVCNCLIWRQQDATRNSIESAGHAYFSTSELHKKNCNEIQELLWSEQGINWNDYPTDCKRGSACYRAYSTSNVNWELVQGTPQTTQIYLPTNPILKPKWFVDTDIPIFTQDRDFIEKWVNFADNRFSMVGDAECSSL